MKFNVAMTEDEALNEAGRRLARIRLSRNMTQSDLAQRSGVSKRSLERLEAGSGGLRLEVFFAVCGALGLMPQFEMLLPEVQLSPQDILEHKVLPKRARKRKTVEYKWGYDQ